MKRCTICENPQVDRVNVLIRTGTSIRQVARLTGLSRATLARHAAHIEPSGTKLALIRAHDGSSEPGGSPADPLEEALALAERARTPRERLRALEQIRRATSLRLRGVSDPDPEQRELLDRNIAEAQAAYRNGGDFETCARALSGWREALHQRLDAVRTVGTIEVPLVVTLHDGTQLPGGGIVRQSLDECFAGVPKRFRDAGRFVVHRSIELRFGTSTAIEQIKVYDSTGGLAWSKS